MNSSERRHQNPCPILPKRNEGIEMLLKAQLLAGLEMQRGKFTYDPNPPHERTFTELFKHFEMFEKVAQVAPNKMPPCRAFGYRLSSLQAKDDDFLPLPRNSFWCIIRPATSLLLNDGQTQHYTTVYRVDRETETLELLDPWPEEMFLRTGLNVKGIRGSLVEAPNGGKLIRINRTEFERVVVGAASVEDPLFYTNFPQICPEGCESISFMLALAKIAFGKDAGQENLIATLPYCRTLMNLYLESSNSQDKAEIRDYLSYIVVFASYWTTNHALDKRSQKSVEDILLFREEHFPRAFPGNKQDTGRLFRLGQVAWSAGYYKQSEEIFTLFIQGSPNDPNGYLGRAKARNSLLNHTGTIEDTTKGLALLEKELRSKKAPKSLKERSNAYEVVDFLGSAPDRRHIVFIQSEMHFLRGNALFATGDYLNAEQDGKSALVGQPHYFGVYILIANSLKEQKKLLQSVPFYETARKYAPPALQSFLTQTIQDMRSCTN